MTGICTKLLKKDILLSRQTCAQKYQHKHLPKVINVLLHPRCTQLTVTCSNSTIETIEKSVKYDQSLQ